ARSRASPGNRNSFRRIVGRLRSGVRMDRRKLIVVSNRGPVTFGRDASGGRTARRGGGGLVTALRSLVSHHDVTWIASAMSEEDREVALEAGDGPIEETARDGPPYRLPPVPPDQ